MPIMRILAFLPLCFVLFSGSSHAAIITAISCSYSDVSSAISSAAPGDTVRVPPGSCTWTSTLTIGKGLILVGAGIANTVISGNNRGEENFLIVYSSSSNGEPFRVSGFTFNITNQQGIELRNNSLNPPVYKVRIDNNRFTNSTIARAAIKNWGCRGVIDSNTFDNMRYPLGIGWGGSYTGSGEWDWANFPDLAFGAVNDNMYVEDNTISDVTIAVSDADQGGRYVFRYNTIISAGDMYPLFDTHGGRGGPPLWSSMGAEIYGNDIIARGFLLSQQGGGRVTAHHNNLSLGGIVNMYVNVGCPPDPYAARQKMNNSYHFLNRAGLAGALLAKDTSGGDNCGSVVVENTTFWMDEVPAGGVTGVSSGTLANIPTTCTAGVGYWATNQSTTSLVGMVGINPATPISGTLYKCISTNTWVAFYTPFTYPHPLRIPPNPPSTLTVK